MKFIVVVFSKDSAYTRVIVGYCIVNHINVCQSRTTDDNHLHRVAKYVS